MSQRQTKSPCDARNGAIHPVPRGPEFAQDNTRGDQMGRRHNCSTGIKRKCIPPYFSRIAKKHRAYFITKRHREENTHDPERRSNPRRCGHHPHRRPRRSSPAACGKSEEELGDGQKTLLPGDAVRNTALAGELRKVRDIPLVIADERVLVGILRLEIEEFLGLLDRHERIG